jgi:hypothetical protein
MGYVQTALVVPEQARSAWSGSDFVPSPIPAPIPEPTPEPVAVPADDSPSPASGSAAWMIALGAVAVGGVIVLLIRPPAGERADGVDQPPTRP